MQRAHRHRTAPQRHADIDQQAADTLEEIVCGCASQPLANGPTVDLDDAPSEHAVKAHRQANVFARWGRIVHSKDHPVAAATLCSYSHRFLQHRSFACNDWFRWWERRSRAPGTI